MAEWAGIGSIQLSQMKCFLCLYAGSAWSESYRWSWSTFLNTSLTFLRKWTRKFAVKNDASEMENVLSVASISSITRVYICRCRYFDRVNLGAAENIRLAVSLQWTFNWKKSWRHDVLLCTWWATKKTKLCNNFFFLSWRLPEVTVSCVTSNTDFLWWLLSSHCWKNFKRWDTSEKYK